MDVVFFYIYRKIKLLKQRNFILGDLHANYKGLIQVLKKSSFNYEIDHLYFIGDLFDSYANENYKCVNELLKIKNLFPCFGNHDLWVKYWLEKGKINKTWAQNYAYSTIEDLCTHKDHREKISSYFDKCKYWYTYKNLFICHAGFDNRKSVVNQKEIVFTLNRSLLQKAIVADSTKNKIKFIFKNSTLNFDTVIVGHTPTISKKPEFISNLINIDTGSGNGGRLTLMNLDTFEYHQSDFTKKLYK